MSLLLRDLAAGYGGQSVLQGLDLSLASGEIGCLLGPSGCGKTTALRVIAGFEPVQAGRVAIAGETVAAPGRSWPPQARGVGLVFQDLALLPHLSVAQNIAFGLHRLSSAARRQRVADWLERVQLGALASRYPHQLSGGQAQRVALARALAPQPRLLLLDEPFSALDVDLRERLSQEVRRLLKAAGTTALLVTHSQFEAFAMADRIGVMDQGRLRQWDSPYNLYHRPADRRVASFVGEGRWLPARRENGGYHTELGRLALPGEAAELDLLLRPDDVVHDDASPIQAEVTARAFRGAEFLYTLRLDSGRELLSLVPSHHDHAIGSRIGIRLDLEHRIAFPAEPRA